MPIEVPLDDRISTITYALDDVFYKSSIQDLRKFYFEYTKDITQWIIISDYYFDEQASNKVITFSVLPNYTDVIDLQTQIRRFAPNDIKNTKTVNEGFIELINSIPLVSFAFAFPQKKYWLWETKDEMKEWILDDIDKIKLYTEFWRQTVSPDRLHRLDMLSKSLSCFERLIKEDKKLKIIPSLYFVGLLGGFLGSLLTRETALTTLTWLSDRDSVNEVCFNVVRELFQITLINIAKRNINFSYTSANSDSDEWYKELTRIPDYLTGAVSNYDFTNNSAKSQKFSEIIRSHFQGNTVNTFVYRFICDPERIRIQRMLIL